MSANEKNNVESLYKEFGEHICLYPFFGAFYQTNHVINKDSPDLPNSVRPCSLVQNDDYTVWNIENNSIHDGRNTAQWKKMRQDMLDGKFYEIHDCRSCSYNEKTGATSPRIQNNKFLVDQLDIDIIEEVKKIIANDNTVTDIITLDYYPSNYCNYACVMCAGGASSKRHTYEVKHLGYNSKIVLNDADPDFMDVLSRVEIINFTGGETVLQTQVIDVIDHLIDIGRSEHVLITLLTNASSSYTKLADKFNKFKGVIYNISIDGIGDVIEYQRRGCNWSTVEKNALELINAKSIGVVVNYVLTAINVFSSMEFIDWCYANNFGPQTTNDERDVSYVNISPVFRVEHLGQGALPPELREIALERLTNGVNKYIKIETPMGRFCADLAQKVINVIETTPYNPIYLDQFIDHVSKEDTVSQKKLTDVVPEWKPYFQS